MERITIASGAVWEDKVAYSRAVRVGNMIEVSGTTAVDGDKVIGPGDPEEQTRYIFEKISRILKDAGASLNEVTRTRIYVTDIARWEAIGKVHKQYFDAVRPATSMVQVAALIHPDLLVEIEVTAVIP